MSEFITLATGVLMPLLISWLKSCNWSHAQKAALSLVVCVLAGCLIAIFSGQVDNWRNVAGTAGVVFTVATGFYQLWFQHTDLNESLESKDVL